MSKYHAVSSGMVTRQALPSITRQRGTTTGNANLMLYGAGKTTVSNNTTFIDSSTNNFTVTRIGDTVQSGFNPFSQASAGSGYFDGTGDYLSVANNAAFEFGTGDFTVETWAYLSTTGNVTFMHGSTGSTGNFGFNKFNGIFYIFTIGGGSVNYTPTWLYDQWVHYAITRVGTTLTLYINGVSQGTRTFTNNVTGLTGNTQIGAETGTSNFFLGYMSNFRMVKGTAVYTANFTPPTSPLTAITNTSLLLLTDNYSIVNSTATNLPVTINGNTTISTAQYPTGMSSSIYFDGNGDYLSIPDNANLNMGTSEFTLEAFIYLSSAPGITATVLNKDGKNTVSWPQYAIYVNSSYKVNLSLSSVPNIGIGPNVLITGATTLSLNTWYHVAATRSGTSTTLWVNGVSDGTSSSVPATLNNGARPLLIGWEDRNAPDTAYNFPGYISNARICKGTALYTANFTPPSAPLSTTVTVPAFVTNAIYGVNQIP
jgi:hypothetical protein